MKRAAFTLLQSVLVLSGIALLAAILLPVLSRRDHPDRVPGCLSHLKQLGLALAQYTQDNDGQMPLVAVHPLALAKSASASFGWADAIGPYVKSSQTYLCPSIKPGQSVTLAWQAGYTDYYLNRRIGGLSVNNIAIPSRTVAMADGNDGVDINDARYAHSSVPPPWLKDEHSPVFRHLEGANYAFVDGHAKWFRHDHAPGIQMPKTGVFTFRP